jgi:hypothetical protein
MLYWLLIQEVEFQKQIKNNNNKKNIKTVILRLKDLTFEKKTIH